MLRFFGKKEGEREEEKNKYGDIGIRLEFDKDLCNSEAMSIANYACWKYLSEITGEMISERKLEKIFKKATKERGSVLSYVKLEQKIFEFAEEADLIKYIPDEKKYIIV